MSSGSIKSHCNRQVPLSWLGCRISPVLHACLCGSLADECCIAVAVYGPMALGLLEEV